VQWADVGWMSRDIWEPQGVAEQENKQLGNVVVIELVLKLIKIIEVLSCYNRIQKKCTRVPYLSLNTVIEMYAYDIELYTLIENANDVRRLLPS